MTWHERPIDDRPLSPLEVMDLMRRPAWMERGECRTERAWALAMAFDHETATDLFVPPNGSGRRGMAEITAARGLCLDCAVQAECLQFALDNHPQTGTWGATSLQERIAMKKKEGTR